MKGLAGVVFQLKKRGNVDDGSPKAILVATLNASAALRLAIAVDEDIDIYNADDVIWAISTRVHPTNDVIKGSGRGRRTLIPAERPGEISEIIYEGGIGLDATTPFRSKWSFERVQFPVDKVDLRKWFAEEQIAAVQRLQSEYAKVLARG